MTSSYVSCGLSREYTHAYIFSELSSWMRIPVIWWSCQVDCYWTACLSSPLLSGRYVASTLEEHNMWHISAEWAQLLPVIQLVHLVRESVDPSCRQSAKGFFSREKPDRRIYNILIPFSQLSASTTWQELVILPLRLVVACLCYN